MASGVDAPPRAGEPFELLGDDAGPINVPSGLTEAARTAAVCDAIGEAPELAAAGVTAGAPAP